MLEAENRRAQLQINLFSKMENAIVKISENAKKLTGQSISKDLQVKFIEDDEELNRIIDEYDKLLGFADNVEAHDAFIDAINEYEDAINPQYPYDFTFVWLIKKKAHDMQNAFRMCIGKSAQIKAKEYRTMGRELIGSVNPNLDSK